MDRCNGICFTKFPYPLQWILGCLCLSLCMGCVRKIGDLEQLRDYHLQADMAMLYLDIELPSQELDLCQMVDIGMRRNFDLLVNLQQMAIQEEVATGEKLRMLPTLTATGEISERSKSWAQTAQSLITNFGSTPSIAREQEARRFDISLAWNIVDFGLAFFRSRIESNRFWVEYAQYERTRQELILEIVREYWNGWVALQAGNRAIDLIAVAQDTLDKIDIQMESRVMSELEGLGIQDRLANLRIQLHDYRRDYELAKARLAQYMGLPPNVSFEIKAMDLQEDPLELREQLRQLENEALRNRPELYGLDVEEFISVDAARFALLQMFPGLSPFVSYTFDADRFLVYHYWMTTGIRAAWNLLNIPNQQQAIRIEEARGVLAKRRRLAMSVGVLAQVNLSFIDYENLISLYQLIDKQAQIRSRLLAISRQRKELGEIPEIQLILAEWDFLVTDIFRLRTFADMQIALERVNTSIGIPLYYRNFRCESDCDSLEEELQAEEEPRDQPEEDVYYYHEESYEE